MKPEEVGRLTDREAWEWYIKPAYERANREQAIRDGVPPTTAPAWEPKDEEETLQYLREIGVVGVPETPSKGA